MRFVVAWWQALDCSKPREEFAHVCNGRVYYPVFAAFIESLECFSAGTPRSVVHWHFVLPHAFSNSKFK